MANFGCAFVTVAGSRSGSGAESLEGLLQELRPASPWRIRIAAAVLIVVAAGVGIGLFVAHQHQKPRCCGEEKTNVEAKAKAIRKN